MKKFLFVFFVLLMLIAPHFSTVNAEEYVIAGCGTAWLVSGVDITNITGLGTTIRSGTSSHQISITFDSSENYSEYYLKINSQGNSTITTDRVSANPITANRYSVTFIINDENALRAFSTTQARTFDVTFFAKRTYFDELCSIGSYTVRPAELDSINVNTPDKYCGTYKGDTFECRAVDGILYPSADHSLCDGSRNTNSQYECCSKGFLSLTQNICPSEPISGCGKLEGTSCKTDVGTYIWNYKTCNTDATICCSQDVVLPSTCTPAPTPTPVPTCGRLVEDKNPENNVCVFGTNPVTSGFVSCLKVGECCRQASQCTPVENGGGEEGGGGDDGNLEGGLTQGPTVAQFDALNPLKIGNKNNTASPHAVRLSTPGGIVTRFLQFAFPIAGLILFAMLSWAGFEILTGAANQKSLDAGKQRATAAIVGYLLLFASYWLMQIVEVVFGISVL